MEERDGWVSGHEGCGEPPYWSTPLPTAPSRLTLASMALVRLIKDTEDVGKLIWGEVETLKEAKLGKTARER